MDGEKRENIKIAILAIFWYNKKIIKKINL